MRKTELLGVDIGGTSIRAARVSPDGTILQLQRAPTPDGGAAKPLARTLADLIAAVTKSARIPNDAPVGVALPGIRDKTGHTVQRAVNLPLLEGIDVHTLVAAVTRRPVVIESDINAATFAQWRALHPTPRRFAYLSLGTGVSGGVVLDGRLLRHTNHGAGQLGFLVVDTRPDAPLDNAGLPGTLSAYLSGPAFQAFPTQQRVAVAAGALAIGIRQIVAIYAVSVVALGGGVLDACDELVDATNQQLAAQRWLTGKRPRVIRGPLPSDHAGVIGAALLAAAAAAHG